MAWDKISAPLLASARRHGLYGEMVGAQLCAAAQSILPTGATAVSVKDGVLKVGMGIPQQLPVMTLERQLLAIVNKEAERLRVPGVTRVQRVLKQKENPGLSGVG
jgi:hypothetical protein